MDEQTRHDDAPEAALEDLEVDRAEGEEVTGGRADISDFNFVHKVDKSSPVLFQ